jgi:hypothetical protein
LWLDAADNSSLVMDGTNVTTWRDKSGNGKNATATGTPTYLSGGGINFNGSSYFLNQTFTMNLSQRSIFIVMQETTHIVNRGILSFIPNPSSGEDYATTTGLVVETDYEGLSFRGNLFSGAEYTSALGSTILLVKAIYNDNMNVRTGSGYLNGTNATNVTAGYTAGTCSGYGVGGRWLSGSMSDTLRLNGVIYEIIVFNTALTTSQRQTIEGYLAHKWGLTKYYSPTTPLTMSGCQLWLDAADSSTVTGTTTVTQWRDKSGNNRHLGVGAGTTSYSSNTIQLNSSYMFVNSPVDLSKVIVFIVLKGTGQFNKTLVTATPVSGVSWETLDAFSFYVSNQYPSVAIYGEYNSPLQINANALIPQVYTIQSRGTSLSAWYNGVSQTGRTLTSTRTSTARGFAIGAEYYNNTYNNSGANASIYEIIVYNSDFSIVQRETIEKYLMQKWGFGAIPSTHPYVNFPPASLNPFLNTFLPSLIPGCQLWLDAADSSTVTGTTTVTAWADKSGNARHLGVGAGTTSYSSNAIQLNSSYMFVNSLVDLSKVTVFIVVQSTGGSNKVLFGAGSTNVSWDSLDGFAIYMQSQIPSIEFYGNGSPLSFNVNISTPTLFSFQSSGSSRYGWLNGGSETNRALNGTRTSTARGFAIGAEYYNNTYNNSSANASFYELLVYNSALSTNERQQVESYLAFKWGLQASLPSDHIYKIAPPSV